MKKKIIALLFICIITLVIICLFNSQNSEDSDVKASVEITINETKLEYDYIEAFIGNEWYLYINGNIVCKFDSFEEYTIEEMKKHLENKDFIKVIYDNGDGVCVYALPLFEYEKSYKIIYSLNNKEYYCWNDDVENQNYDRAQKRLSKLYKYVDLDSINAANEESWQ